MLQPQLIGKLIEAVPFCTVFQVKGSFAAIKLVAKRRTFEHFFSFVKIADDQQFFDIEWEKSTPPENGR